MLGEHTATGVARAGAQEIAEVAVVRDHLQHARARTFLMGSRDQPGLLAVIFREVRNYLRRFTLIRIMLAVLAIDPQVRTCQVRPALCSLLNDMMGFLPGRVSEWGVCNELVRHTPCQYGIITPYKQSQILLQPW